MDSGGFEYPQWVYGDEDEDDPVATDKSTGPTTCSVCATEPTTFAFQLTPANDADLDLPEWVGLCRVCSNLIAEDQLVAALARLAPDSPIGGRVLERKADAMAYLAPLVRRYRPRRY
jgi:hypothetical protein